MFIIECDPAISESHIFKFDNEKDAFTAASVMAKKHNVVVTVSKEIKRFRLIVQQEVVQS